MSASVRALVKPGLLGWARERSRMTARQAAKRLQISVETLERWEAGDLSLTLDELRAMAALYQRPLAVFYLPEPPLAWRVMRSRGN